jgi:hypothetical protein
MKFNTGTYMDGTEWSIPLVDVRLQKQWTKKNVTLYTAYEEGQVPYFIQVVEMGCNKIEVEVAIHPRITTSDPLSAHLKNIYSLNIIK